MNQFLNPNIMPPSGQKKDSKLEQKQVSREQEFEFLQAREEQKLDILRGTTSHLTGEKTSQLPYSPSQISSSINESADNAYQKDNVAGMAIPMLGLALGAYLFHRTVMKDPTEDDFKKGHQALSRTKSKLRQQGLSESEIKQSKAYKEAMARLEEMKKDIQEVKSKQEKEIKDQRSKLEKEREKIKNVLGKYKKLLKKHNQGKLGRVLGLATGGTFAFILMSYATSENVRKYFQTKFGIPDIAKFAVGGKLFVKHLQEGLERINKGKSTIQQEFKEISEMFDSLQNMKKFSGEIEKQKPELKLDPVIMNKIALYPLDYILKKYEEGKTTKKLNISEITDVKEQEALYKFVEYINQSLPEARDIFENEKKKNPKLYERIKFEDLQIRVILILKFRKKVETPYWYQERTILAARMRMIGYHPSMSTGIKFIDRGKMALGNIAGWGESRYYARYMYYLEKERNRVEAKITKITASAVLDPEVVRAREKMMQTELEVKKIIDSAKSNEEIIKARDNAQKAQNAYNEALMKKLSPENQAELKKLVERINKSRAEHVQVILNSSHALLQQMEIDKKALNDEKKELKQAKKSKNIFRIEEAKNKITQLQNKLDGYGVKSGKEFKGELQNRIGAALNQENPRSAHLIERGNISVKQMYEIQRFSLHHQELFKGIQSNPNHPEWVRIGSVLGVNPSEARTLVMHSINESASWKKGFIEHIVKGGFLKTTPVIKTVDKYGRFARKGLLAGSLYNDYSTGNKWGLAETGLSIVPFVGDGIDLKAAWTGKDLSGRQLDAYTRAIRATFGGLGMVASTLSLIGVGVPALAGLRALKGGAFAVRVAQGEKKLSIVYKALKNGAYVPSKILSASQSTAAGIRTFLHVSSYPIMGITLATAVTPFLQKIRAGQIAGTSLSTGIRTTYGVLNALSNYYNDNPIPKKGFTPNQQGEVKTLNEQDDSISL